MTESNLHEENNNEEKHSRQSPDERETEQQLELEISETNQVVPEKDKTKDQPNNTNKWDDLREWLKTNKVFFETVAAAMLTIMAIALTFGQLLVTMKQTTFLEQQTLIEKELASPQFVIVNSYFNDEETNEVSDEKIFIYNQGNIAHRLEVKTAVFFKLAYFGEKNIDTKVIPIDGYFWVHRRTENATGLMMTIENEKNAKKRWDLNDKLLQLAKSAEKPTIDLSVIRYVKLTYYDMFNELHVEYYYVEPVVGAQLIDSVKGKELFNQHLDALMSDDALDLYSVTIQDLYDLFE